VCLCAVEVLSQPTPDTWKLGAGIVINALLVDDNCGNDSLKGTEVSTFISAPRPTVRWKPAPPPVLDTYLRKY
jgi:hypothetical protein